MSAKERAEQAPDLTWTLNENDDSISIRADEATVTTLVEQLEPSVEYDISSLPILSLSNDGVAPAELLLSDLLGEGGMALVHSARQVSLGREVAVKLLKPINRRRGAMQALVREAQITGSLEHPNIIPVHALGRDEDDTPVFVMKRVEGTRWEDLIHDPELPLPSWGPSDRLAWHLAVLIQVCNAIKFAHSKGIVHRDLKPDNIMVGEFGEVYVLDWGIALNLRDRHRGVTPTQAELLVGTPAYMAPEMLTGDPGEVTERTDIYLLGSLLHRILTRRPRHEGTSLIDMLVSAAKSHAFEYDSSTPEELAVLCNRATALNPSERFESVEEFRRAIEDFLQHRSSIELSAETMARMVTLRELMASPDASDPDADHTQIYKLFGECRFGFRQAYTTWKGNTQAYRGLQNVLELMVEHEIAQGDYKASMFWIAELLEPNPALEARAESLHKRLEAQEQEVEKLRQIEHEMDVDVGGSDRSAFALTVAVASCLVPLGLGFMNRHGIAQLTHSANVFTGLAVLLLVIAAIYLQRDVLLQNQANRRLMLSLVVAAAGLLVHRVASWLLDTPILEATGQDLQVFAVATAMMAVSIDPRLKWASIVYLCASLMAAWKPELAFEFTGVSNFLAMLAVAILWRQQAEGAARSADVRGLPSLLTSPAILHPPAASPHARSETGPRKPPSRDASHDTPSSTHGSIESRPQSGAGSIRVGSGKEAPSRSAARQGISQGAGSAPHGHRGPSTRSSADGKTGASRGRQAENGARREGVNRPSVANSPEQSRNGSRDREWAKVTSATDTRGVTKIRAINLAGGRSENTGSVPPAPAAWRTPDPYDGEATALRTNPLPLHPPQPSGDTSVRATDPLVREADESQAAAARSASGNGAGKAPRD